MTNTELSNFFNVEFTDISIKHVSDKEFDIEARLLSGESIRFFVYPEIANFKLFWYGSSLESNDSCKVLYLQAVATLATVLNDKENLLSLIDILRSKK